MTLTVKPEAFFDSLSLAHKLDNVLDGFKLEEIHLFSYFSSILFLYKGNPLAGWEYRFILSANGYPFSSDIDESITRHKQNGLFEERGSFYTITARGADEFNKFKVLSSFSKREDYLNAACSTSLLVPYSQTLRALLNDSEMKKAKDLDTKPWLDESQTYTKFKEISEAIGVPTDDLLIPAVTWINYINQTETLNAENND